VSFQFEEYTVRPIEERERGFIDQITDADPHHHGIMDADFFLRLAPGEGAWAVEDKKGKVLLYFKTQNAVRLSLQFTTPDREANREILTQGMAWLEGMFQRNGFQEIIFDTTGRELRLMAKRRLGFRESPGELVRALAAGIPHGGSVGLLPVVQQASQGEG
jgi:hypothetical protein